MALAMARSELAFEDWRRLYDEELRVVLRDRRAAELHELADMVRFRYGLAPQPSEEVRSLLERGREIWEARALLLAPIPGRRNPRSSNRSGPICSTSSRSGPISASAWPPLPTPPGFAAKALAELDEAAAMLGSGPRWNGSAAPRQSPRTNGPPRRRPRPCRGSLARPGSIATWVARFSATASTPAPPGSFSGPSTSGRRTSGPTSTRDSAATSSADSRTPSRLPRLHRAGPESRRVLLQPGTGLRGARSHRSRPCRLHARTRVR